MLNIYALASWASQFGVSFHLSAAHVLELMGYCACGIEGLLGVSLLVMFVVCWHIWACHLECLGFLSWRGFRLVDSLCAVQIFICWRPLCCWVVGSYVSLLFSYGGFFGSLCCWGWGLPWGLSASHITVLSGTWCWSDSGSGGGFVSQSNSNLARVSPGQV